MKLKDALWKYKHVLLALYIPIYMYCFAWLERRQDVNFVDIHCFIDDWIPFCEIFIIPYLLWFIYMVVIVFFLFLCTEHLEDFYRCAIMLMLGMSTCLLIYYLFPNMQSMRPEHLDQSNIFIHLINFIYESDTNTNVLPSIHVYNAVATHVAFCKSYYIKERKALKYTSGILCILICLSTMFLKQHSFWDVVTALTLFGVYYCLVYWWGAKRKETAST